MNRLIAAALLLFLCACSALVPSAGAQFASATADSGESLVLFTASGSCKAPLRQAQLLSRSREVMFAGCWVLKPHEDHIDVHVDWDDGDITDMRADAFTKSGV